MKKIILILIVFFIFFINHIDAQVIEGGDLILDIDVGDSVVSESPESTLEYSYGNFLDLYFETPTVAITPSGGGGGGGGGDNFIFVYRNAENTSFIHLEQINNRIAEFRVYLSNTNEETRVDLYWINYSNSSSMNYTFYKRLAMNSIGNNTFMAKIGDNDYLVEGYKIKYYVVADNSFRKIRTPEVGEESYKWRKLYLIDYIFNNITLLDWIFMLIITLIIILFNIFKIAK